MPTIQQCINNTFNSSISETPFYALFSYDSSSSSFTSPKLSYAEDEFAQHIQKTAEIRQHWRNRLLRLKLTTPIVQIIDIISTIGVQIVQIIDIICTICVQKLSLRVCAKIDKHRQLPKNKLDLPISAPFKVTSQKGKVWKL